MKKQEMTITIEAQSNVIDDLAYENKRLREELDKLRKRLVVDDGR
jgi:regulator of replication initiation timing